MRPFTALPFFLALISCHLLAESIETFYGALEVDQPVLLELIHSPALQRLKSIHQYGVAYYTRTHPEEYNRFDHSLGVFAILRVKGASLEEQIAGLLHDVSHTAFSHVGDWVFGKEYQEHDYQSTIHTIHLAVCGIEEILNRHGYTIEQVSPKRKEFTMLEQSLPNLSADRIDYNIQGAYFQHFLTHEEAIELFHDLFFKEGRWILTKQPLAAKLMRFSIFMTEDCWSSPVNYLTSKWLAEALLQGIHLGVISWKSLHFGLDQEIWQALNDSQDPLIQERLYRLQHPYDYFRLVAPEQATSLIRFRCRGIDPWIQHGDAYLRLSYLDQELAKAFEQLQLNAASGWPLEIYAIDPKR